MLCVCPFIVNDKNHRKKDFYRTVKYTFCPLENLSHFSLFIGKFFVLYLYLFPSIFLFKYFDSSAYFVQSFHNIFIATFDSIDTA